MEYAIYTRGKQTDYQWSTQPAVKFQDYVAGHGVAVYRDTDDSFSVYMFFRPNPTDESRLLDTMSRPIGIGCLFVGCNEDETKGLTACVLRHWDDCYKFFSEFVCRSDEDRWEVNNTAIDGFVAEIMKKTTMKVVSCPCFTERVENANTSETRCELIDEIARFRFSEAAGFKLVVDSEILVGSPPREIRSSADRYLVKNGTRKILTASLPVKIEKPHKSPRCKWRNFFLVLLILLLLASIGGNGFLGHTVTANKKTHREAIQKKEDENKELKAKNNELEAENNDLKETQTVQSDIETLMKNKKDLDNDITVKKIEYNNLEEKLRSAKKGEQEAKEERNSILKVNEMALSSILDKIKEQLPKVIDRDKLRSLRESIDKRIQELEGGPQGNDERVNLNHYNFRPPAVQKQYP